MYMYRVHFWRTEPYYTVMDIYTTHFIVTCVWTFKMYIINVMFPITLLFNNVMILSSIQSTVTLKWTRKMYIIMYIKNVHTFRTYKMNFVYGSSSTFCFNIQTVFVNVHKQCHCLYKICILQCIFQMYIHNVLINDNKCKTKCT